MKWTKRADIAAIERDKAAIIADMTNREVRSELGRDPEQWQTPAPQPEPKGPQHTVTDAQIAALVRAEVATVLGKIGHLDRMVTMIVEETVTSDDILAKAITKLKTEI